MYGVRYGLLAASTMLWPDETSLRLYLPSVDVETVTWYVSPEPKMAVPWVMPLTLPVLP